MNYYSQNKEKALEDFATTPEGLSAEESQKRLSANGKNELSEGKKKSKIKQFFSQFADTMILVLLAAALVSAALAIVEKQYTELADAGIILLIVIINAVIGFVQENKAEAALAALKNMNKPFSKVIRGGQVITVRSEDIVVGDIVDLEAGDIVPADIRLLATSSLKIQEAALTGESVPSEKNCDNVVTDDAPLGDRSNMAYSSGLVAYGRGTGVVVATGMNTEVGKIAKMLSESDETKTPLQKQLAKTAKILTWIVLGIAIVIFAVSLIKVAVQESNPAWMDTIVGSFMTAVAIAVAAIPEGLPAVVTIVLSIGVQIMSKRNAIVRNLPAVETLGCCEIICSDKTGTLTLNQMTVKKMYTPTDGIFAEENYIEKESTLLPLRAMILCNDTHIGQDGKLLGDPTETALVAFAQNKGYDYSALRNEYKRVDEIPFDSVRKLMTTINEKEGKRVAYVKGATDLLINRCTHIYRNGEVLAITEKDIAEIKKANSEMANTALRVLGIAIKTENIEGEEAEQGLTFIGLVGMIDPPRKEVKEAVRVCRNAGMTPLMITGDHKDTAAAIAREIGILYGNKKIMTGAEIDALTDEEFVKIIEEYAVFARVSPENKVRIVKAYKALDKVVAMTGDGVNDAPSIKEADIGIGMGITGTDVSKGASDIVLADDNFATIIGAVEEGRKIYSNITKAIQYLLSANIAEVLCLFIATLFLPAEQTFLTAVMILWINLVTDALPALALGMEKAELNVMDAPPRKDKSSLFAGKMGIDIIIQGLMQTVLVMGSFLIGYLCDFDASHHITLATIPHGAEGSTMAFITLGVIQLFHCFNLKSKENTIFKKDIFGNKLMNISFVLGLCLMALVVFVPTVNQFFGTPDYYLDAVEYLIAFALSVAIIPFVEIQKAIEKAVIKKRNK